MRSCSLAEHVGAISVARLPRTWVHLCRADQIWVLVHKQTIILSGSGKKGGQTYDCFKSVG